MADNDLTQIFSIVTKGGPAAIVLAVFWGLASLVREVRSGKLSMVREADLLSKLTEFRKELDEHREKINVLEAKVAEKDTTIRLLYRQRDQARTQAERLGYDPQNWPPDPGGATPINPAVTSVALPTVALDPPGSLPGGNQ